MLFLGSGMIGISHNLYWNAKSIETIALGGVLSSLQVAPLVLLTVEAWRFRNMPESTLAKLRQQGGTQATFGLLAIAAMLFCGRWVIAPDRWNGRLLRFSFWSLNLGQTLTWLRGVGVAIFLFGGVVPLTWFMVARWLSLKPAVTADQPFVVPPTVLALAHPHGAEIPITAVGSLDPKPVGSLRDCR